MGDKPHVTSQQFRQILEGMIGQESYIITSGENLEPELASNNILKIRSGMMSHHGNVSSVKIGTYDEVEFTNGSRGMKRIDLVVNRYKRNAETNIESNEWVVIMGTPAESNPVAPAYTIGNLQNGDLVDDCPVFELHFDGINVTEVTKLTMKWAIGVATTGFLLCQLFPSVIVRMFTTDPELIEAAVYGLHIVFAVFPIVGFQMVATNFFLSIGMSKKAIFLSLTRQMLFLVPCLLILPRWFGTLGVWISIPIADTTATIVTALVLINQFRKFHSK